MRFQINICLDVNKNHSLPKVYNYYVYAFFLSHLAKTDSELAHYIHDFGIKNGNLKFKFFTFSKIKFDTYYIKKDVIYITSPTIRLIFSIQIPELYETAVESFLKILPIKIGSKYHNLTGYVSSVETFPDKIDSELFYTEQAVYITERKKKGPGKFYLNPWRHDTYMDILKQNILNKYFAFYKEIGVPGELEFLNTFDINIKGLSKLKEKLKNQKYSFYDEVKIADKFGIIYKALKTKYYKTSGYQFIFKILTDNKKLLKFIYTVGLGCNNAQGFGFVRSINE